VIDVPGQVTGLVLTMHNNTDLEIDSRLSLRRIGTTLFVDLHLTLA